MPKVLRLLIISDLHAISDSKDNGDSHLLFINGESIFGNTFIEYIKSLEQKIDVLVCAGDLTNCGSKENFELSWKFLNKIKNELEIEDLLCVPGNHDHQSRPEDNEHNPKEYMQYTIPQFPLNDFVSNTFFWAWNWCHTAGKNTQYNAILVNTSATHGYGKEYKHGRIPFLASDRIANFIKSPSFTKSSINILLCHHHPLKMEHVDKRSDYEAMDGGGYLLRAIERQRKGPWFIIHGHKHFADVSYAPSSTRDRHVIFSAGSFSAQLYETIQDRTSNQFYIVEIDLEKSDSESLATGIFRSYEYRVGRSWSASSSENLPAKGGFGNNRNLSEIAKKITLQITEECPFINRDELSAIDEDLKHLTPREFEDLIETLENEGFSVDTEFGSIVEVGKKNAE